MLTQLQKWNGAVEYNGSTFENIQAFISSFKTDNNEIHIKLCPKNLNAEKQAGNASQTQEKIEDATQYKIFVKQYMTKKAEPSFDFMAKWNNDVPMPYRLMIGEKIKETRGMVYMKLHADITEKQATMCMCCGRPLTNPVSQYFGIGPECGGHNYINPFDSEEELKEAVSMYREKLRNVTWEGWVIRSSIIDCWEIKEDGEMERCNGI